MSNQVYCGNLNYDAKRQDVTAFFEEAGFAVTHINMAIDRETGRNKSFAFVEFPTEGDAVNAAATLDGREFMGREVKVKPAERRAGGAAAGGATGSAGRTFGSSSWRSGGGATANSAGGGASFSPGRSTASDNWRTRAPAADTTATYSNNASSSVYLGGLPILDNNEDAEALVREIIEGAGLKLRSVSRMFKPNPEQSSRPGGGTMYCFVEMESVEDANTAMVKCDGVVLEGGAKLKCNVSKGREDRAGGSGQQGGGYRARGAGGAGGASRYGSGSGDATGMS